MKPLPKNYDHKEAEPRWQLQWEEAKVYAWDESQPRENTFVIDTPPPTVSGVLHMGHIFSYTQADFVARYQRMSGKTVFYPMGFDDNGLPTERLVEKIKGKKANQYPSREDFIRDCREVVKSAEDEFRKLFKSTALSVDWKQEYETVSPEVRKLSQMSFLDLWTKGEAYRDFRPTYWDWVDQTAIAQAEIENKELPGTMNEILFSLEDGTTLHIATTRPELLGACVAVMYHPEDPNAAKYKGKTAITPVFGVKVPMIPDEAVEREKGTGLVMCCTFGDDTDKEWQRKHELPRRTILAEDGKVRVMPGNSYLGEVGKPQVSKLHILFVAGEDGTHNRSALDETNCIDVTKTSEIFAAISSLKPKQANAKMIELLQAEGKLMKQDNITHTVKVAERSQTPIEIIPTYQWFVKITDKKDALKNRGAECHWYPEFMHIRLDQWIDGLKEDWCVSRQRFFGVPFPIWHAKKLSLDKKRNPFPLYRTIAAAHSELPVDPIVQFPACFRKATEEEFNKITKNYTEVGIPPKESIVIALENIYSPKNELWFEKGDFAAIHGDKDVMDTWATSSISPQISAHAITGTSERFKKLFPADLRPQAHEIIRTWAFYTIVKAHLHEDSIPWKNLMISGWCLDSNKQKMSKSKGNVITPVDLIVDKGADVVRYWASTSRLGADTAFSEDLLKIGRKLVTKLWNATAFAAIHLTKIEDKPTTAAQDVTDGKITGVYDRWILTRLHRTVAKATQEFTRFEYSDARVAVEEFFWKDFCDNYLELVKGWAYGEIGDAKAHASAHLTLYYCLNAILRLFAPFLPHVTEELFSHLFDGQGSVHARGMWPKATDYPMDEDAEKAGAAGVSILEAIRKKKSEESVSIKFPIESLSTSSMTSWSISVGLRNSVAEGLKSAGSIANFYWSDAPVEGVMTSDGQFKLSIKLAKQVDPA